jgi:exodeoxyribonuclease VII small subunit
MIMKTEELTYKTALSEIEGILAKLEKEELDVDELAEKVKRVSFLLKFCKEKLTATDNEIQQIIQEMGN